MKKYNISVGNNINNGKDMCSISIWEGNMGLYFRDKEEVEQAIKQLTNLSQKLWGISNKGV